MIVLIVDDEEDIRDELGAHLARVGLACRAVEDGPAAIEAQRTDPADVLIMDMRMPGMDGVETTRRVRAFDPDVTVIALSGFRSEYEKETEGLGIRNWVNKPLVKKERKRALVRCIREGTAETRVRRFRRTLGMPTEGDCEPLSAAQIEGAIASFRTQLAEVVGVDEAATRVVFLELLHNVLRAYPGSESVVTKLFTLLSATTPGMDRAVAVFEERGLAAVAESYRKAYQEFRSISERVEKDDS